MKKQDFENNIDKHTLPYHESDDYVRALIGRCADYAIAESREKSEKKHFGLWRHINYRIASTAAAIAIVASVALGHFLKQPSAGTSDTSLYASLDFAPTFDDVLASLSDEQMEMLSYSFVDIPDYTNE